VKQRLPSVRLLVATAATSLVASLALALATPATLVIDGQRVASDVAPVTTAAGAFLPLRAVAQSAGAETSYDALTGTITVRRGVEVLRMRVGSRRATLDGQPIALAHAPFTVRGRTMVASATIAHAFSSTVSFDAKHGRVDVRTPGVVVGPVGDDEP
jgi:hypothetical protein